MTVSSSSPSPESSSDPARRDTGTYHAVRGAVATATPITRARRGEVPSETTCTPMRPAWRIEAASACRSASVVTSV